MQRLQRLQRLRRLRTRMQRLRRLRGLRRLVFFGRRYRRLRFLISHPALAESAPTSRFTDALGLSGKRYGNLYALRRTARHQTS